MGRLRPRLDCSGPRGPLVHARSEGTPFLATDGVLCGACPDRWRSPRRLGASRRDSPDGDGDGDDGSCGACPSMRPMGPAPMDWRTTNSPPSARVHLAMATSSPDDDDGDDDDVAARACTSFPQRRLHYGVSPTSSHPRRCSFRSWNLNHHPGQKKLHY